MEPRAALHTRLARNARTRSRWAAIGAALAVTFGAGGLSLVRAAGEPSSTFVPITPCRVFDTRTGIGPRTGALTADATQTFPITGDQGNCLGIPAGATAVALNVTLVGPTAETYLTIAPSGAARPEASSLNAVAGQGPTPNAVLAALAPGGSIDVYNFAGEVHVVADVNGYFLPAAPPIDTYTRAEVDALLAPQARQVTVSLGGASAGPATGLAADASSFLSFPQANASSFQLDLPMPVGARLDRVDLEWYDTSAANASFTLKYRQASNIGSHGSIATSNAAFTGTLQVPSTAPVVAGNGFYFLAASAPAHADTLLFKTVSYTYTVVG